MEDKNINSKLASIYRIQEEQVAKNKAQKLNLPYLNLVAVPIELKALGLVDKNEAKKAQAAVIARIGYKLRLAVVDPKKETTKKLSKKLKKQGFDIDYFIVSQSSLYKAWSAYDNIPKSHKKDLKISLEKINQFTEQINNIADLQEKIVQVPTGELLAIILAGALQTKASDIHLEPGETQFRWRYRMDGILTDVVYLPQKALNKLSSRIKLLSDLKINVKNQPQNGRLTIVSNKRQIDVRVSILPGSQGETIALRLLNADIVQLDLEKLGLEHDHLKTLRNALKTPNGMILATGPTGSGKTTTLYSCLVEVHKPGLKIITLEDPVEYRLPGLVQTQINPSQGYTFANALKNSLRQDPDIILLGEIRDKESAETALNAALTGHQVFSTLHTNDAVGAIPRLLEMGVKPFVIAPALRLVIAQRLVRKIHKKCQGKGCLDCANTGYKGRIGIFEMFAVDDEIKELILEFPSAVDIKKLLIKKNHRFLYKDGLKKVERGLTTKEELERVAAN